MTSTPNIPARTSGPKTPSFGVHRQNDRPASAIRAGASTMPEAWQTRGIANKGGQFEYGAPVRSFADILADPVRWAFASKPRGIASVGLIATLAIGVLF